MSSPNIAMLSTNLVLVLGIFASRAWCLNVQLIYEKDNPMPNNTKADEACFFHIDAIKWACFKQGANEYQTTIEKFLFEWPNRQPECCAVVKSFECFTTMRQFEERCTDPQIAVYFEKVQSQYRENGCERYYPPAFQCNGSMSSTWPSSSAAAALLLVGLSLLVFSSFGG